MATKDTAREKDRPETVMERWMGDDQRQTDGRQTVTNNRQTGDKKPTVPDRQTDGQTDRQKVDKQRNRKTNIQGPN
jgi:hypothetical protein